MKKNISFLFAVGLFLAVLFVGCGDKAKDSSKDSPQSTAASESSFDFGALKSEAEAQNIDLSKIMLKDSAQDSSKNPQDFAPQITKSLAKFYLLEGNIGDEKAMLYLKISSTPDNAEENQSNAIAFITGKMLYQGRNYTIKGEVDSPVVVNAQDSSAAANQSNQKAIRLELIGQYEEGSQIFEAQIAPSGEVSATFIGDNMFVKGGTNAEFKKAQGKINEATIFGISVAQKHKGKDFDGSTKDFDFNVATQIPLITSPTKINFALDKINSTLREIAMPELREYGEDSTNFSSVSTFDIDYIDEKIIVLGNYNYLYSGGAHGTYSNDGVAFLLASGEQLSNEASTLLKDAGDTRLLSLVNARLSEEYGDSIEDNVALSKFKITSSGVEFYWGIYEIAPYAVGIVRINFTFAELAEFIKEDSAYAYLFNLQK